MTKERRKLLADLKLGDQQLSQIEHMAKESESNEEFKKKLESYLKGSKLGDPEIAKESGEKSLDELLNDTQEKLSSMNFRQDGRSRP